MPWGRYKGSEREERAPCVNPAGALSCWVNQEVFVARDDGSPLGGCVAHPATVSPRRLDDLGPDELFDVFDRLEVGGRYVDAVVANLADEGIVGVGELLAAVSVDVDLATSS